MNLKNDSEVFEMVLELPKGIRSHYIQYTDVTLPASGTLKQPICASGHYPSYMRNNGSFVSPLLLWCTRLLNLKTKATIMQFSRFPAG